MASIEHIVTKLVRDLENLGFGRDDSISGADTVDVINNHWPALSSVANLPHIRAKHPMRTAQLSAVTRVRALLDGNGFKRRGGFQEQGRVVEQWTSKTTLCELFFFFDQARYVATITPKKNRTFDPSYAQRIEAPTSARMLRKLESHPLITGVQQ